MNPKTVFIITAKLSFGGHFTTRHLIVLNFCIKLIQDRVATKPDNFLFREIKKTKF